MGKREPIIVAYETFKTKTAAKNYVRDLIARYKIGATVTIADNEFLLGLMERHHNSEKKSSTIVGFRIKPHSNYPSTKTIYFIDDKGIETDFSWIQCIDGKNSLSSKIKKAMRDAVLPQMLEYKNQFFLPSGVISHNVPTQNIICPISGENLTRDNCDIDHKSPSTFKKILNDWLLSEKLTICDVKISPQSDENSVHTLTDDAQLRSWLKFHDKQKVLQLVYYSAKH